MARIGSDEWRQNVSDGTRRGMRSRARHVTAPDLRRWWSSGAIAKSLQPALAAATDVLDRLIDDLGGPDRVSARQRALLQQWLRVRVVSASLIDRYLRTGETSDLDRGGQYVNLELRILDRLRLLQPARDAPITIHEYLQTKPETNAT